MRGHRGIFHKSYAKAFRMDLSPFERIRQQLCATKKCLSFQWGGKLLRKRTFAQRADFSAQFS